jgi:hypothetical protein
MPGRPGLWPVFRGWNWWTETNGKTSAGISEQWFFSSFTIPRGQSGKWNALLTDGKSGSIHLGDFPLRRITLPRKRRHNEEEIKDDDEMEAKLEDDDEDDEKEDDEDDDTIDLDQAEEEEDDDDDEEDDETEEFIGETVEVIERRKLFQSEAEDILENLTLEDYKEVLKDKDLNPILAPKLKKFLVEVINKGEVTSMDEAWESALERLQE